MNTIWSSKLQSINTLDESRELRFSDSKKDMLLSLLGLKPGMAVLEVGCGPGALSRKLARWLGPSSSIIGVDRDTTFIRYAAQQAETQGLLNLKYIEGDALALPLDDHSVDACTSHTVVEHVPNREFLLEQKRVCRQGGRVSVMFTVANKAIVSEPDTAPKMTAREKDLWEPISQVLGAESGKHIQNHWSGFDAMPALFDDLGFGDVQVDAIALPVVADDSRNSAERREMIIREMYKTDYVDAIQMGLALMPEPPSSEHIEELRSLIEKRYSNRCEAVKNGLKLWDYRIAIVLVISGIVN